MIFTSIYYIFFASSVILYGAGFNNLTIVCDSIHELKLSFAKVMFSILITCILSFQFMHFFLIPLRLVEFYPLIALIIFLIISTILETVVRITTGKITSEFIFSYLLILLALNESLNLTEVIIISIGGLILFFVGLNRLRNFILFQHYDKVNNLFKKTLMLNIETMD